MSTEKERKIVVNRIQCDSCKDVIVSTHTHDYKHCKCGKVSVDGGSSYLRRGWEDGTTYTEMSLYSDDNFEEIRELLSWGSRGKNGDQPLTFLPLSKMENGHIEALLNLGYVGDMYKEMLRKELKYRQDNNIKDIVRTCNVK